MYTLRTLTKVCRTPNSSLYCINTLSFYRNLSIATERSDCFTTTNEFNGENDPNSNNNHFQQGQNGFYGGNLVRGEQNFNGVYGKHRGNEPQHSPAAQIGNFSSGYVENGQKNEFLAHPDQQNGKFSHGYIENGPKNGGFENSAGKNENFAGNNGVNSQNTWQQNGYGYESARSIDSRQNQSGDYGGFQQNNNGYSGSNYANSQQNYNGYYTQSSVTPQQNTSSNYTANALNSYGSYAQSTGMPQQSHSNNYTGYYTGNTGMYQDNTGYHGSNGEIYQQNSNVNLENNPTPNEESVKPRNLIEELDKFCEEDNIKEAVKILELLSEQSISLDLPRYYKLMKICSENQALAEAKTLHKHLTKTHPNLELKTHNKILEMYCKCESLEDAFTLFDKMPRRNLTSWDIMISGLAQTNHGEEAIDLFSEFKQTGLKPDGKMFLNVFFACSVINDPIEGLLHYESMRKDYDITPTLDHYTTIVHMLGSVGYLNEAMEFIQKLSNIEQKQSVELYETLMNLSRAHGDIPLGDYCYEVVNLLNPSLLTEEVKNGLLPNEKSKSKGLSQSQSQSLLESRSRVHEYRAGDRSSPEHEKLYTLLRGLRQQMKEAGYIAETKFVLHDIDIEGKEEALMAHSERLAVAQGLMTTPTRYPIRIIKNLRICVDCHNAMKIISKLAGRELIIRDAKRFHHFKDGLCSCKDYW